MGVYKTKNQIANLFDILAFVIYYPCISFLRLIPDFSIEKTNDHASNPLTSVMFSNALFLYVFLNRLSYIHKNYTTQNLFLYSQEKKITQWYILNIYLFKIRVLIMLFTKSEFSYKGWNIFDPICRLIALEGKVLVISTSQVCPPPRSAALQLSADWPERRVPEHPGRL